MSKLAEYAVQLGADKTELMHELRMSNIILESALEHNENEYLEPILAKQIESNTTLMDRITKELNEAI